MMSWSLYPGDADDLASRGKLLPDLLDALKHLGDVGLTDGWLVVSRLVVLWS